MIRTAKTIPVVVFLGGLIAIWFAVTCRAQELTSLSPQPPLPGHSQVSSLKQAKKREQSPLSTRSSQQYPVSTTQRSEATDAQHSSTKQPSQTLSTLPDDNTWNRSQTDPPEAVEQPYFDLDRYLDQQPTTAYHSNAWYWQWLPNDLIYKAYLAGAKESRMAGKITYARHDGWLWENTLGGRIGLLRYGDKDPRFPQGFQLDAEGSAQVRLDITRDVDVRSVDFRGGIPLSYGFGRQQIKFAYYHMSSHLGDEFLLKNPGYPRLNWSRDAFVLGYSIYPTDSLRLYAETAWAFHSDVSEPWEFQFGLDWAPTAPTGIWGAPFFAVNAHLREELDYGGNINVETGWCWMTDRDRHLLRIGMQYYNGKSPQNAFYNNFESLLGFGVWYDY